ncbi:MAG: adenylate/guanylate cyclase domain-containing protein [Proteobacteria bacterium]|nr:MAG: adenylate/guanylate cyclase domain-containing protein [Pseudomonadota bacterium]
MAIETRYARSGDLSIAYQVVGGGPVDLVVVPGWVSHVEHAWEEPDVAAFLRRLAAFSRLILLDRRGTGLSDRVARLPNLEERMDDVRAVLDAAGVSRAALLGISEGGPMCTLFAASHPERTSALILCNTFARLVNEPGYSAGHPRERFDPFVERVVEGWGRGSAAALFAPSQADDPTFRERWSRYERLSVSPGGIRTLLGALPDTDVRDVLPSVRVPTLVLHRAQDRVVPAAAGRYLAEHIEGARYVELPGADHFAWTGDPEPILRAVQEFLTGETPPAVAERDRVLATVLFTDLTDSTALVARLGDRRWSEVLASYHAILRREVARFGGREVDTAGDGFLAAFDGPARAIRCACAARDGVSRLGVALRAGLHTGECLLVGDKVTGLAVHVGARIAASAPGGEVRVSRTVKELVAGSGLRFSDRGEHALKGVPETWQLFAVET